MFLFVNTIKFRIILFTFLLTISLASSVLIFVSNDLGSLAENYQNESAQNILKFVYSFLESESQSIKYDQEVALESKKKNIKSIGDFGIMTAEYNYSLYRSGQITEKEAKAMTLSLLRTFRYDQGIGYIWVNNREKPKAKVLMHPTAPNLEGKYATDPIFYRALDNKKHLLEAMIDLVSWKNEGFLEYRWNKPTPQGLAQEQPKISYVRLFRPWDWVIGTGIYYDDIEIQAKKRREVSLEQLRNILKKIRVSKTGYVFVFDKNLNILAHPNLENQNLRAVRNATTNRILFDELVEASKTPNIPLRYLWDKSPGYEGKYIF